MKKNFLFAMAMAAVFAGCSSDDDPVANAGENAKGYLSFAINMPSMNSTRAGWADGTGVFDDGEESEYSVKDATIYLFNDGKVVQQIYTVPTPTTGGTPADQNVTKHIVTSAITASVKPDAALVVVNGKKLPTITANVTTFDEINNAITACSENDFCDATRGANNVAQNIMMSNAPIKVGDAVQTLVPITDSNIKLTAAEAETDAARVNIYVERILAKVSITTTSGDAFEVDADAYTKKADITINNWDLDNTNTKTFPVRKFDSKYLVDTDYQLTISGNTYNRFYGVATNPIRTYFAEDPNYNVHVYNTGETELTDLTTEPNLTISDVDYCLENTFPYDKQFVHNTTRVIFKAQYVLKSESAADVYTLGTDRYLVYKEADILTNIKSFIINKWSDLISGTSISSTVPETSAITPTLSSLESGIVDFASTNLQITGVDFTTPDGVKFLENLNKSLVVTKYKNGICYYEARIKHFGDTSTPWSKGETVNDGAQKHEGRYGVVRNNWYELNVTGISAIGSAEIPTDEPTDPTNPDNPDDEQDQYIAFKINILSWAKRTQDVIL